MGSMYFGEVVYERSAPTIPLYLVAGLAIGLAAYAMVKAA